MTVKKETTADGANTLAQIATILCLIAHGSR